jgi:hypothetical protein
MQQTLENFINLPDVVPSLRTQFEQRPFPGNAIPLVKIPIKDPEAESPKIPANMNRNSVVLSAGESSWTWEVASLRELFRGDRQPVLLEAVPAAYEDCLLALELHVLHISEVFGDRRDAEMREIYSALRRRPDGRSTGFVHDYMWQAAAMILGTHVLSQAEFEAIMGRLEQSCRTFEQGPVSRNYVATLWTTFDPMD